MRGLVFEWDPDKAASNLKKHGVGFDEALSVFADPLAKIHGDPDHSTTEHRELIVGRSGQGRVLFVLFTERRNGLRIISARPATRKERRAHEENLLS